MSSISTSNALGLQSAYPAGKQPIDPNRNPLTDAHPGTQAAARQGSTLNPRQAQALETAQKLVATTLIKPILANARAARDAPAPWGQTQAEKQFGALLDNRIADDIAKASNFPIAQRIAEQIMKNAPITDLPDTYTPVDIFG